MATIPDEINDTRAAAFISDGLTLRGVLHSPDGKGPFPIVVLGHGLGGLKEWTLPEVAAALVKVDIAAFWFDHRNFDDSDGEPRNEVSHYGRLQDWQNAISYVTTLANVDTNRIGVWGTSLGARDVVVFSWADRRVKAVVAQASLIKWTPELAARMAGYADDLEQFYQDLAEDCKGRVQGLEPGYLDWVRSTGDEAKAAFVAQLTDTESRNYTGCLTHQSYQPTSLIDITPFMELLAPTPVLFILTEQDLLPGQKEAYAVAKQPKQLVTVPGNHFSPYVESKQQSIAATQDFFRKIFLQGDN